jgi:hypothetical protein
VSAKSTENGIQCRQLHLPGPRQMDKAGGYLSLILNIDSSLSNWIEGNSVLFKCLQIFHRILQKSQLLDCSSSSDRVSFIRNRGSQKFSFEHLPHSFAALGLWVNDADVGLSLNKLLAKLLSTGNSQTLLSCLRSMFSYQK